MKSPRAACKFRAQCGATGHVYDDGSWRRCTCLELELAQRKLRELYTDYPNPNTPLKGKTETDLLIQGPLEIIRRHAAGALMAKMAGKKYLVMDAYRLIEIFLEKDEELETSRPATEADLLILLLGYGDPRNRYLPELVLQALTRRALMGRPTWVILGIDLAQVPVRYTTELAAALNRFEMVNAK